MTDQKPKPSLGVSIVAGVIVLALFFWIVGNMSGDDAPDLSATDDQAESKTTNDTYLASDVDAELKEQFGIAGSYSSFLTSDDYPEGSLVGYITEIEDVSTGTVRVHVQTDADEDELKALGRMVMANVGYTYEELTTVVVRGTDGLDYNVFRSDVPALR